MKLSTLVLTFAAGSVLSLPVQASEALAKKYMCMTCHTLEKKLVGPSYHDVAAKYKGDKTAEAKLMEKVKKGGVGAWGQIPMPPNDKMPDADLQAVVKWVLSTK